MVFQEQPFYQKLEGHFQMRYRNEHQQHKYKATKTWTVYTTVWSRLAYPCSLKDFFDQSMFQVLISVLDIET